MLLTLRFSLEIGKLHSIERMCMAKKWRHWYESQRRSGYKSDMWWKCAIAITDPITLTMVRRHQLIPLKLWNTLLFWMNMIIELGLLRIEWLWKYFLKGCPSTASRAHWSSILTADSPFWIKCVRRVSILCLSFESSLTLDLFF